MSFILNPYIFKKTQPNTFIGGVGDTITNRSELVAKLTGISASDIKAFSIDSNNNVSCYIGKDFNLRNRAFEDDTDITFFYNTDGRHKNVADYIFAGCTNFRFYSNYGVGSESPWATGYGMFEFSKVSHVFLENATVLRGYRTFGNISNTKIYIPNIISTNGVTSGANSPFSSSRGLILYMNENYDSDSTLNTRVNDGLSGGQIAQVIKITDFTTPDSVNDLSVSDYGATYIKLDFTPIAEADFYEVWIKKTGSDVWELFGDLPDNKFLVGLDSNTTYQIKLATCDEFWNGSGFFSDPNKRAFSNTVTQTTASTPVLLDNLVSYWDLRTNANDQWGSNNGTATGVNFVSGGIAGDCADFGSGTSNNIEVADDDTLSFGNGTTDVPFTAICWVNWVDVSGNQTLLRKGAVVGSGTEYAMDRLSGNIRIFCYDQSNTSLILSTYSLTPTTNNWYMFAMVYGGAGVRPDLYINGSLVTTSDASSGTYVAMENLNVPLIFGKSPSNTTNSLNGKMCEISIWKKALTAGEISDIYSKNINGDGLLD